MQHSKNSNHERNIIYRQHNRIINTQTNKTNEYKKRTEIEQHHLNTANTENTTQRIHKIVNETTPTTITKETENNSVT